MFQVFENIVLDLFGDRLGDQLDDEGKLCVRAGLNPGD
jgi:hypothetical protein